MSDLAAASCFTRTLRLLLRVASREPLLPRASPPLGLVNALDTGGLERRVTEREGHPDLNLRRLAGGCPEGPEILPALPLLVMAGAVAAAERLAGTLGKGASIAIAHDGGGR